MKFDELLSLADPKIARIAGRKVTEAQAKILVATFLAEEALNEEAVAAQVVGETGAEDSSNNAINNGNVLTSIKTMWPDAKGKVISGPPAGSQPSQVTTKALGLISKACELVSSATIKIDKGMASLGDVAHSLKHDFQRPYQDILKKLGHLASELDKIHSEDLPILAKHMVNHQDTLISPGEAPTVIAPPKDK